MSELSTNGLSACLLNYYFNFSKLPHTVAHFQIKATVCVCCVSFKHMCEATVVVSSLSPHLAQPFDPVYIMDYFKHNSTSVKWVVALAPI